MPNSETPIGSDGCMRKGAHKAAVWEFLFPATIPDEKPVPLSLYGGGVLHPPTVPIPCRGEALERFVSALAGEVVLSRRLSDAVAPLDTLANLMAATVGCSGHVGKGRTIHAEVIESVRSMLKCFDGSLSHPVWASGRDDVDLYVDPELGEKLTWAWLDACSALVMADIANSARIRDIERRASEKARAESRGAKSLANHRKRQNKGKK